MSNTTSNSSALIRASVYSKMIQEALQDELLSFKLAMDVTDFGDGTTLNIPSIGDVVVRDVVEDVASVYDAIDTGNFQLTITDFISTANYVTRKLLEDSHLGRQLVAAIPRKHYRAIMERFETRLFAVANAAHTVANANAVNGQAHRIAGSGTSGAVALLDFAKIKTSLDKANCPSSSRVMFLDPLAEYDVNQLTNVINVSNNPTFEGIITSGMSKDMRFLKNIYGVDIYLSNRLPDISSETVNSVTVTSGKAAIAMCVADEDTMPLAMAWRRMPQTEGEYDKDFDRDEYITRCRFGLGVKREESMAILIHNVTNVV
jgi:hypothetical protein